MEEKIVEETKNVSEETKVNEEKRQTYNIRSGYGMSMGVSAKIYSTLTFKDEVLDINMTPKRFNKAPVIYYSDITKVTRSVYFSVYSIIIVLILIVCAIFTAGAGAVIAAGWLWLGYNQKITIYQRNGMITKLYARKKAEAEEIVNNIQSRMKI